jgi:uncharacterized protein
MSDEQRVVMAIHDVALPYVEECAALMRMCRAVGVMPALFVVPEWHGTWPLEQSGAFVRWLRHAARDGADVLLHGYRHDEVGSPRTRAAHWRALGRTAGEGEFLSLSVDAAQERIVRGRDRLTALGLSPIGFVPPAWLASDALHVAMRECGLPLTEDAAAVRDVMRGRVLGAPAVRWSARTRWRALGSRIVALARTRMHRRARVVRVALHPRDLHDAGVAASVREAMRWWTRERVATRYRDLPWGAP